MHRVPVMEIFEGDLVLTVRPWSRHVVLAALHNGRLLISNLDGRPLGRWSVLKVSTSKVDATSLEVTLADERFRFEVEDPSRFLQAFETEIRHVLEWSRTQRALHLLEMPLWHARALTKAVRARRKELRTQDAEQQLDDLAGLTEDRAADRSDSGKRLDFTISLRLLQAQKDAVDALRSAIESWFGFYFLLGEGTDQDRLHAAANGLHKAALQLRDIAENLANRTGLISATGEDFDGYRTAVEKWSEALELIARGAVLDHQETADDGFARLNDGSTTAEGVVDVRANSEQRSIATEPLAYLSRLTPATKTPRDVVEKAKQPWRRAVVAAASPFQKADRSV